MTKNKKIYIIEMQIYNGTVLISNNISAYATEELAEQVAEKLEEKNGQNVQIQIKEINYYESEQDVPILNK